MGNFVKGGGMKFFIGWWESDMEWSWFRSFEPFSMLRTFCKYWSSTKIKICMTCVNRAKSFVFFFNLGFLSRTFKIHRAAGEGEAISLSPLYHFHPLHRHFNISRAIIAESSPLHIATSWTGTGNLWFPSAVC